MKKYIKLNEKDRQIWEEEKQKYIQDISKQNKKMELNDKIIK